MVTQSVYSARVGLSDNIAPLRDRAREVRSFRGIVIGIALSAILWAPLGVVAIRLF